MLSLNAIWFILIFVLLGGYAILDGFDLGVGVLTLFSRSDQERRVFINAIGPVWDGNEVWLLTGGGALFAAFPPVYATVFSGFYPALMLVLASLIFRAVSMEFRGKVDDRTWRRMWDFAFGISSLLLCVLLGVALGNVLRGINFAPDGSYSGTFFGLLNLQGLTLGLLALAGFTMQGASYLTLKHNGDLKLLTRQSMFAWGATVVMFITATSVARFESPLLLQSAVSSPVAWIAMGLLVIAVAVFPAALSFKRFGTAFLASSVMIGSMMALAGVGLFPRLLPCLNDPSRSLTVYNSSSSHLTLQTMFIIALIGMPCVIVYTAIIHRIFRGKVMITPESY